MKQEGAETSANDTSGTEGDEPTAEQKLETATAELKVQTTRADKAESSNQGLRGSLKEKDLQIQKSAGLESDVSYLKDAFKLAATQGFGVPEGDLEATPEKMATANKVWEQMEAKHNQSKADDAAKVEQARYVQQAQGMLKDAEDAGIAKGSEEYEDIYDHLVQGNTRKAERLINKAKTTKPEGEEELKQKWITEGKRLAMEGDNQLASDTGGPQGSSTNDQSIMQNYQKDPKNPANVKAYNESRQRRGLVS